jgi:hypothetical protein
MMTIVGLFKNFRILLQDKVTEEIVERIEQLETDRHYYLWIIQGGDFKRPRLSTNTHLTT